MNSANKNFWIDFCNPPHVNLFLPILTHLEAKGYRGIYTAKDFVETIALLEQKNIAFTRVGKHGGKHKYMRLLSFLQRDLQLFFTLPSYNISFSTGYEASHVSWLRRKTSIIFDDNDISPNWLYSKFASYVISPDAINKQAMDKMGVPKNKLITYNGFKEDIYIADYIPDPAFMSQLPFSDFVTVRPENIFASYVAKGAKSIVPELITLLTNKGFNILYLPRYKSDFDYVKPADNIFIPTAPLNGLDVCYYSMAVLTGAGTFSREAALMGKPAVSFYAGTKFLSVDAKLFNENKIFFSRNPQAIVDYVLGLKPSSVNFSRSKKVQQEVFNIIDTLITKLT